MSNVVPPRPPLSATAVRAAVLASSALYTSVEVVGRTGSTNADLIAAARDGAAQGSVLVAEEQTAGRGRLDRSWQSQPGAALTFSLLLRPSGIAPAARGWLPLLTGVAVVGAIAAQTGVRASLKWPNDVLAGGAGLAGSAVPAGSAALAGSGGGAGKLAGILAEQAGDAIVVGIGLNVSASRDELPSDRATSLWLAGAGSPDRQAILIAILREIERWYLSWTGGPVPGDATACGLRAAYLSACSTVSRDVRVELPGGGVLAGRATGVDTAGCLLVSAADGVHAVSAGDVIHVRPGR